MTEGDVGPENVVACRSQDWIVSRVPFFYGWVVVAIAFVTMGIGVNTRTAFSLLFPPILDEFGWSKAQTSAVYGILAAEAGAMS